MSTVRTNLETMQQKFRMLESKYFEIYEWIPYDQNNWDVYSPKISSFISDIGPQILGMFELICSKLNISPEEKDFPRYFTALNNSQMLSNQGFLLLNKTEILMPFKFEGRIPSWWVGYNEIKHNQPQGECNGILEYAINSFGALFVLHHICDLIDRHPFHLDENLVNVLDGANWFRVHTNGNYIKYSSDKGISSTLYESFLSQFYVVTKRYQPDLKNHIISDPPQE